MIKKINRTYLFSIFLLLSLDLRAIEKDNEKSIRVAKDILKIRNHSEVKELMGSNKEIGYLTDINPLFVEVDEERRFYQVKFLKVLRHEFICTQIVVAVDGAEESVQLGKKDVCESKKQKSLDVTF